MWCRKVGLTRLAIPDAPAFWDQDQLVDPNSHGEVRGTTPFVSSLWGLAGAGQPQSPLAYPALAHTTGDVDLWGQARARLCLGGMI